MVRRCDIRALQNLLHARGKRLTDIGGTQANPEGRSLLPKQAFTMYQSSFLAPSMAEGFEDISRVNFEVSKLWRLDYYGLPAPFSLPQRRSKLTPVFLQTLQFMGDTESRKVWSQYWV